jgi:hypothetical protein
VIDSGDILLRWVRYDFLSNEVDERRNEFTTLLTWTALSSTPSSASSADALAPVSSIIVSFQPIRHGAPSLTNIDSTEGNHCAIDFIDHAIDLLHVVAVGHELIAGNYILKTRINMSEMLPKGKLIEDLCTAWGQVEVG